MPIEAEDYQLIFEGIQLIQDPAALQRCPLDKLRRIVDAWKRLRDVPLNVLETELSKRTTP